MQRLGPWIPENASLARIGEDSLGLILDGSTSHDAETFVSALCNALDGPFDIAEMTLAVQVHAGIASDSDQVTSSAMLVRHARQALSRGLAGHDRVSVFEPEQQQASADRLRLLGFLGGAVERNELRLYCQPKINMRTGNVAGAETLVRWIHPTLGMLQPAQFIPLAEHSGMIVRVTNWMLHATLGYLRSWQSSDDVQQLAINLSALDVRNPAMALNIRNALDAWGIRPELVQFELTESALIEDPVSALSSLVRLKDCGVEIFIDDFGTGYASLSYLQKFPIDGIKLDRSFVAPMLTDANSAAIVESTIALGHALHHSVVAEGVESAAVFHRLAENDCDFAQGYLFSRPMPIEEFSGWLAEWSPSDWLRATR